jgi:uncharacterized glyoxalase superfamily protein PhnB
MAMNPPKGYHSLTPALSLEGAARAIERYQKAFGAEEVSRFEGPGGKVMHAELRIGDSILMLGDSMPEMGSPPSSSSMWMYVDDCDAAYRRAVGAGATSVIEPADMFWGDRMAQVTDPWGIRWSFATRIKEMSPDEMRAAGEAWMKQVMGPTD